MAAYVIGNTLSSLPYLLPVSIIPGEIAFYLTGLRQGFDHFMYFALVLFAWHGARRKPNDVRRKFSSKLLDGHNSGIWNSGHVDVRQVVISDYHVIFQLDLFGDTQCTTFRSIRLYKNEVEGIVYQNNGVGKFGLMSGDYILKEVFQVELGNSKWVDLGILLGMVVLYRLVFLVIIKSLEKVKPAIKEFTSVSHKKCDRVMVNPNATP